VQHTISWVSEGVSISFMGPSAQGLPDIVDDRFEKEDLNEVVLRAIKDGTLP
jgi:hypothetical protein